MLALSLTLGAGLWGGAIVLSPLALRHGGLPAGAAAFVYEAAGLICHQRPERSFHLAGVQWPVCGRCAGLYFAGAAGALLAWAGRRPVRAPGGRRPLLLAAALPMALSVAAELAGLTGGSNLARMLSALPLGAAAGWVFVRALRSERTPAPRGVAL